MVDKNEGIFKAGIQVERGFADPPQQWEACRLGPDWDWHSMLRQIRRGTLQTQLRRLCDREGFEIFAGSWDHPRRFSGQDFPSKKELLNALQDVPGEEWSALQVYYPMTRREVAASSGTDLIDAILAAFTELVPVMNEFLSNPLGLHRP